MSLHFIIDGYNLIKQAASILKRANLEDSRAALIRFLIIHRPQGSINNQVTVVFDAREGNYYSRPIQAIKVIFTKNQSADEKIKSLVENSPNPKNIVVVTNDREIQLFARHSGSQVRSIEVFLSRFIKKAEVKQASEDKFILPPAEAAKITDELRKIWVGNPQR